MITGRNRFNIYLLISLAAVLACGCHTTGQGKDEKGKALSTLRIHLQTEPDIMDFSTQVPVYRSQPVLVTVDKSPFLTEANVSEARVVDVHGGFALQIQFDRQGSWLLEEYTTTNPGKHLAIFCEFGQKKKEARWLAAPLITRRISNGVLTFAPDASREEAEQIATGLNNIAAKRSEASKW
jgi:preprotein translocase subunit SecD